MRIIGGKYKGRRLQSPLSLHIRPTSDRLRESLFNMIMHGPYPDIDGAQVLDMFAGTGAFGLEALSRGAAHVTFFDNDPRSIKIIRQNTDLLDVADLTTIKCIDATQNYPEKGEYDIIFLDPPYEKGLLRPALEKLRHHHALHHKSLIITESSTNEKLDIPDYFDIISQKSLRSSQIHFLIKTP